MLGPMKHVRVIVVVLALWTLAAGCGTGQAPPTGSTATPRTGVTDTDDGAEAGAPDGTGQPAVRTVATVAPLADLVQQVLGDRGTATPLVPPGTDSHTYEPRPDDVAEIEGADAYFGNGLGLNEGALALAESAMPDDAPIVRLGEQALDDDELLHGREGGREHGHDRGHQHRANPHTWLHVPFAIAKVDVIAEVLAEVDPEGAEAYHANAESYREELRRLHESIAESAATVPEGQRTIVTFHDAYRYFADAYGFEVVGAVQPSDVSEPAPGEVAALIDSITAEDVPAVFGSQTFADDVSEQIAAETGAAYYTGLSDDVLPGNPGDPEHSYVGLVAHNARVIIGGLGGNADLIVGP